MKKLWIDKCKVDRRLYSSKEDMFFDMLKNRGVYDMEEYLNPSEKSFHNPHLMKGMSETVDRIERAISNEEKIVIFGDYDVDGVSATSILFQYFKEIEYEVGVYIPNRKKEGYGLNKNAIYELYDLGYTLCITVDCGISAVKEVELCNELSLDIIITDHHQCPNVLPSAYAIINPHQEGCAYPFSDLCGAGIAFKLVQALKGNELSQLQEYLEIASVGTVADIVPLVGENRSIVSFGLNSINTNKINLGIQALINVADLKQTVTSYNIGYQLAPRINAGGRLDSAKVGFYLLTADSDEDAKKYASVLDCQNIERRDIEKCIFEEAIHLIEEDKKEEKNNVIVVSKKGWNEGVIGIVASRITERYHKPSFVFSIDDSGMAKGSGRSIPEFHLFRAMEEISDCMLGFGGHSQAAGLSIEEEKLGLFEEKINLVSQKYLTERSFYKSFFFESELSKKDLDMELLKKIKKMEPFGMKNSNPLFLMKNVKLDRVNRVGMTQTHFLGKFGQYSVLGFQLGDLVDEMIDCGGKELDLLVSVEENIYRDSVNLQLKLRDYKWIEETVGMEDIVQLAKFIIESTDSNESRTAIKSWNKETFESNTLFLTSNPDLLKQLERNQVYLDCCINNIKFISNIEKICVKDYNNIIICDSLSNYIVSHQKNIDFEKIHFFNFMKHSDEMLKLFSFPMEKNISFLEKIINDHKIKISSDMMQGMTLNRILKMWIQVLLLEKLGLVSYKYFFGDLYLENLFTQEGKDDYLKALEKIERMIEI